jgi:hypothetical protein
MEFGILTAELLNSEREHPKRQQAKIARLVKS